jgi:GMP synthase (glutamine-hydrolysing)
VSAQVLLLTHETTASPGKVGDALHARGVATVACRPFAGEALPGPSEFAGVVLMGGRMSANDEHLDFIRAELAWIPRVLAAGTPYFGICLGAQLLARALGARVTRHAHGLHEIGYQPIRAASAGSGLFPAEMHVYQWHNEGFELAHGAELLAEGDVFAHQAFRYGNAVGVQFHPEVTPSIVARWIEDDADLLRAEAQPRDAQLAAAPLHDPLVGRWLDRFLDGWLDRRPHTAAAE